MAAVESSRLIIVNELVDAYLNGSRGCLVPHLWKPSWEEVLLVYFVNAACSSEELQNRLGC